MLIAENISKQFSGVAALKDVSLELYAGKVNAILGENGAGKSTLMKILSGVYSEYEGQLIYKNRAVHFQNTKQAQAAGIAIIHQELNLIPWLNITENIYLGREIVNGFGILDKKQMRRKTEAILKTLNISIDPNTKIAALKVGQQQVVEIAKALVFDAELIIMDEPTSAISESEVQVLFGIIAKLRSENKAIVYISHKLDEVFRIADRYIVLRDGMHIVSGDMQSISQDDLIQKMVGREIQFNKNPAARTITNSLFAIRNISLRHPFKKDAHLLKNISFTLNEGEILGIFGLMGAGRTELMETIFGLHPKRASGTITIQGKEISIKSPSDAIDAGLALVPEDRKKDGILPDLDVQTNICITTLNDLQTFGWLSKQKENALTRKYVDDLKIKVASNNQQIKKLSGGNQQKIVLAKWLATNPKVLMLDEPTRGIDINAKHEIYKLITALAANGMGVILVSSELPEILALSDRILVMAEGNIATIFDRTEASEDKILNQAIPKTS